MFGSAMWEEDDGVWREVEGGGGWLPDVDQGGREGEGAGCRRLRGGAVIQD